MDRKNHPEAAAPDMTALYQDHGPALNAAARRLISDPDAAQDLVAETMAIAWQKLPTLDQNATRRWLLRVLHNRGIDAWRVSRRSDPLALTDAETALATYLPDPQLLDLWAAVEKLAARRKRALLMRHIEGFSVAEIAEVLKISENSVKTHLRLALVDLRVSLGSVTTDWSASQMDHNLLLAYAIAAEAHDDFQQAEWTLRKPGFEKEWRALLERRLTQWQGENPGAHYTDLEVDLGLISPVESHEIDLAYALEHGYEDGAIEQLEALGRVTEAQALREKELAKLLTGLAQGDRNNYLIARELRSLGREEEAKEFFLAALAEEEARFEDGAENGSVVADILDQIGRHDEGDAWRLRDAEDHLTLQNDPSLDERTRAYIQAYAIGILVTLGQQKRATELAKPWQAKYEAAGQLDLAYVLANLVDQKHAPQLYDQMRRGRLAGTVPWDIEGKVWST